MPQSKMKGSEEVKLKIMVRGLKPALWSDWNVAGHLLHEITKDSLEESMDLQLCSSIIISGFPEYRMVDGACANCGLYFRDNDGERIVCDDCWHRFVDSIAVSWVPEK